LNQKIDPGGIPPPFSKRSLKTPKGYTVHIFTSGHPILLTLDLPHQESCTAGQEHPHAV